MKKNNDFEYVKDLFDRDKISVPKDLDACAIKEKISNITPKKVKFYKKNAFKATVSAVACAAVVLTSLAVAKPYYDKNNMQPSTTEQQNQVLNTFESIDDIKKAVKNAEKGNRYYNAYGKDTKASEEAFGTASDKNISAEGGAASYSQTYKQVDAVDEGDIIKNDGSYIYWYVNDTGVINIYDKSGSIVSVIKDFEYDFDNTDNYTDEYDFENEYLTEMYLFKNSLIINTQKSVTQEGDWNVDETMNTYFYDITNVKHPVQYDSFSQSGGYVSSRLIENRLYLVSCDYVYSNQCKTDDDYLPYICDGKSKNKIVIPCESICYCGNSNEPSYLVVSEINIDDSNKSTQTKAVFGAGSDIYCNESNMYITMNHFNATWKTDRMNYTDVKTQIIKVSLSQDGIQFTASGEVEGNIHNQFSLDEKDGMLRIATTSYNNKGEETNNLYVLDENLKQIGAVTGFAPTESIKAVRFIGELAYVITYEQTDPLFVIDLSDPATPSIKGEVEITGFSSLLVPVDENTLLGIGYSTEESERMEAVNGTKLALFDISNPENPKVLDSCVLENYESYARDNHRALVVNKDKGYYAIPYDIFADDNNIYYKSGAVTFEVSGEKINITNDFNIKSEEATWDSRCTYIDDTLYLLDSKGEINLYNVK